MKRGISLVVLIITILVLVVLAGVIIINADHMLVNTDKAKLQIDIAQIEALMDTYKIRNNGTIGFEIVSFDTSSLSQAELEQFAGESIVDNKVQLYVVNLEAIDAESSNFGNLEYGSKDRFLYSITTGKVYYEQGLEVDNITYYYIKNGEV